MASILWSHYIQISAIAFIHITFTFAVTNNLKSIMIKYIVPICCITLSIFFTSCGKSEGEELEIATNLLRNGNFEDASLLDDLWTPEGDGYAELESIEYFEGKYSLKLGAETCRSMKYVEYLPVENGKSYFLSFAIKMNGNETDCSGQFIVSVHQGAEEILYFNITKETALDWNQQVYYINSESDEPISIEFIVGLDELLLDDMQFKEIL